MTATRKPRLLLCTGASSKSPYCSMCYHGTPHEKELYACAREEKRMCRARRILVRCERWPLTPKQKVLRREPTAKAHKQGGRWAIHHKSGVAMSDWFHTPAQAWADAASRL